MIKEKKILKNYLLYFLVFIIVCIYGITHTSALTYETAEGYQNNITVVLVAPDYSDSPINVPINSQLAFNQVREVIIQVNSFNFVANRNYQLELYLPQQDLGRANFYTVQGANGESCLVSYDNSAFDGQFPRWAFQCPNSTNNITIDIKNSNNQILWDNGPNGAPIFTWGYSYLRYSSTSLSGSGIGTDDIINNQNQNTQNIINNQNQNTQDIINNQNQNTQQQIQSQQVCKTQIIDKKSILTHGAFLYPSGNLGSQSNFGITDYISLSSSDRLSVDVLQNGSASLCFYREDFSLISCIQNNSMSVGSLTIPTNTSFFRASINSNTNLPIFSIYSCKNGNQALDDTLNDDNVDDNNIASSFDDFNDYLDDNSTITQLITLPITLYTAILNNLNGNCSPFNLGELYGEDLILPCINISQYLGNSLWTMIDIIISGFAIYAIAKKMIKVFNSFSSLREGDVIDD